MKFLLDLHQSEIEMRKLLVVGVVLALAGCSSASSRMADCQAQGVSRDTCYLAEQNRHAAIVGAAEKQAMENAQHAQAAHKSAVKTWRYKDVTVSRDKLGIVSILGKPATLDAEELGNKTYSAGISQVIFYKNGKVALMQSGQFAGWMK